MQREVSVILPDIHSAHNVGSFFRTSDAAGAAKIYLVGFTATPEHPHVQKVSLGAEHSVSWEQHDDLLALIEQLQASGVQVVAVERTPQAQLYTNAEYSDRVAFIFGNERTGLGADILECVDTVVELPMRGEKESLNVAVAGGIILYDALHQKEKL